nr:protein furry homolog-like [Zootoca vivipara]
MPIWIKPDSQLVADKKSVIGPFIHSDVYRQLQRAYLPLLSALQTDQMQTRIALAAVIGVKDGSSPIKDEQVSTASEDTGSFALQEQQESLICQEPLELETPEIPEHPTADSYTESICEDDVTLALKELDERCEEEEADFSALQDGSSPIKDEQVSTASEDTGSFALQEQQESLICQEPLELETPEIPEHPTADSYTESICEDDVTLALKELDERCEEEEADFSGLSSQDEEQDGFPEVQTSPPPSPFLSAILAAFQPQAYDDEEEAWRCHVNQMLSDTDGSSAVYTFHVFSRLFQTIQRKFGAITHESISFLGENLQRIGTKFKSSLDVMMMCSECPTVFVDAETLMSHGLLETLKFSVLELQEHLDTYNAKREAAEQWLKDCKRTFGTDDGIHGTTTDAQHLEILAELELCRRLYKLHFQLLLLFQAYCKLISQVDVVKKEAEVINMSEELAQLEAFLKEAESASDSGIEEMEIPEASQANTETAIHSLIETLRNKEFMSAIVQVKAFRYNLLIFSFEKDKIERDLYAMAYLHQNLLFVTETIPVMTSEELTGSKLCYSEMKVF